MNSKTQYVISEVLILKASQRKLLLYNFKIFNIKMVLGWIPTTYFSDRLSWGQLSKSLFCYIYSTSVQELDSLTKGTQ